MLARTRRAALAAATTVLLFALLPAASGQAEPCTRDTLRRVVDEAGARLRVITAETQPRIMASLRKLKEKRGWSGPDSDEKVAAFMSDARTVELDSKAATLLARIDELSQTEGQGSPDCSRLAELEATSLELQATVRTKAQHIIARLDDGAEGGDPGRPAIAQAPIVQNPAPPKAASSSASGGAPHDTGPLPAAPATVPKAQAPRGEPPPLRRADAAPIAPPPLPPVIEAAPVAKAQRPSASGWNTESNGRSGSSLPAMERAPLPPIADNASPPYLPLPREAPIEGFSRDEIRDASRGFFGTISGGLASVTEHAFSTLGTPTAYILGNEGGGAFIAGVRYGKGTLFLRNGIKRDVYWHGPSIGYDFGAAGSKTMFLVYNLVDDRDIFTGYSGVDGSAYLVGGVGMTVLTDGKVIMAPIRSGLGMRLGANIGYIRFTARPTWNPF